MNPSETEEVEVIEDEVVEVEEVVEEVEAVEEVVDSTPVVEVVEEVAEVVEVIETPRKKKQHNLPQPLPPHLPRRFSQAPFRNLSPSSSR